MKIDFKRPMIWGKGYVATIIGTKEEIEMLELLCDKTHHIHKNPTGRKDIAKTCGSCHGWKSKEDMSGTGTCDRSMGYCGTTHITGECSEWRAR